MAADPNRRRSCIYTYVTTYEKYELEENNNVSPRGPFHFCRENANWTSVGPFISRTSAAARV